MSNRYISTKQWPKAPKFYVSGLASAYVLLFAFTLSKLIFTVMAYVCSFWLDNMKILFTTFALLSRGWLSVKEYISDLGNSERMSKPFRGNSWKKVTLPWERGKHEKETATDPSYIFFEREKC